MPLETVPHYTRAMLRARPDALFVFGDNMERRGFGGQAAECRGEPNAVGIPTKWAPSMGPGAFFSDADFDQVRPAIDGAFLTLAGYLRAGGVVVLPADGIGTGRAQLAERAPWIYGYVQRRLRRLGEIRADQRHPITHTPPH